MIDPTDLRPLKINEIKVGGTFYLKDDKGEFLRCKIDSEEIKDPFRAYDLKIMTEKFIVEGRLFVRINRPFQSFV